VGDDDHRCRLLVDETAQQTDEVHSPVAVGRPGRVVGEDHRRLRKKGTGNRDALLLSIRERCCCVVESSFQPESLAEIHEPGRVERDAAESRRESDVPGCCQGGDQVEPLAHQDHLSLAQRAGPVSTVEPSLITPGV